MKLRLKFLSIIAILSVVVLTNCGGGGGSEAAPEKTQLAKLKKETWSIVSASLNSTDRTSDFAGFTLTINGDYDPDAVTGDYPYTFSIVGSRPTPSPWPGSGNWEFGGNPENQIVRDDEIGIIYSINSNGQLQLSFDCAACDYAGARTNQVNGAWVFILD